MKAPIITMVGCLSFASGCLIVASNIDKLTAARDVLSRHSPGNVAAADIFLDQILACLSMCWPLLLLVCAASYAIARLSQRPLVARAFIIMPLLAVLYSVWRLPRPSENDLCHYKRAGNVECVCVVESIKGKNTAVSNSVEILFPRQRKLEGRFLLTVYGVKNKFPYQPGQRLKVLGIVRDITNFQPAWQRNRSRGLLSSGVYAKLVSEEEHIEVIEKTAGDDEQNELPASEWQRFWESGRKEIIRSHENALGDRNGDLLSSMVLGDRVVHLPDDLKQLFRNVGLSHLLAASGFNLSIVVASSYFLARLLPIPALFATIFAFCSTACFVCLAGPSPSVVRAAMLSVFFLSARLSGRRLHGLAALSLTLLIAVIADPLCISDVGLQLSYVATAGIMGGLQWVIRHKKPELKRRVIKWFEDTVTVICVAQLSVLPLQLIYFRTTGLLFLPANLVVDPVVAPVTILGFVSSIIAFASSLVPGGTTFSAAIVYTLDILTSFALNYMIDCATYLATYKGLSVHLGPPVPAAVPVYYACFAYFLYTIPIKRMRVLGVLALSIGLSVMMFRPDMTGEVLYVSKESAMVFRDRNAIVLDDKEPDWLGKQLLSFAGCNPPKQFDDKTRLSKFSLTKTKISLLALERITFIMENTDDKLASGKPLNWYETQEVLGKIKSEELKIAKYPVVIWTRGKYSALLKIPEQKGVYVASTGSLKPILITKSSGKKKTDIFYPFRIERECDQLLTLR